MPSISTTNRTPDTNKSTRSPATLVPAAPACRRCGGSIDSKMLAVGDVRCASCAKAEFDYYFARALAEINSRASA